MTGVAAAGDFVSALVWYCSWRPRQSSSSAWGSPSVFTQYTLGRKEPEQLRVTFASLVGLKPTRCDMNRARYSGPIKDSTRQVVRPWQSRLLPRVNRW